MTAQACRGSLAEATERFVKNASDKSDASVHQRVSRPVCVAPYGVFMAFPAGALLRLARERGSSIGDLERRESKGEKSLRHRYLHEMTHGLICVPGVAEIKTPCPGGNAHRGVCSPGAAQRDRQRVTHLCLPLPPPVGRIMCALGRSQEYKHRTMCPPFITCPTEQAHRRTIGNILQDYPRLLDKKTQWSTKRINSATG